MKVAILYSGLPNMTLEIFHNHKKYLIDHYDCDIYCSTWHMDGVEQTMDMLNPIELEIEKFNDIQNIFNELLIYAENKRKEVRPINVFSMYYKLARTSKFIENKQYDIVVRHRFDTTYKSKIILSEDKDKIKIPKGEDHGGINDRWAYGPQNLISAYNFLFKYIPIYTKVDGIVFHPETLLKHHCKKQNIDILRTEDSILLRGKS
jgi:hypothetical protein